MRLTASFIDRVSHFVVPLVSFQPSRKLAKLATVALASAFVLTAGTSVAHAQAKQLYVRGKLQHINGINLPWMKNDGGQYSSNFSHDIGDNHYTNDHCNYVSADVDKYYADIQNMHANVVRIFLFEGLEGLKFGSNGHITGIDSTFLTHLDDMVNKARAHNLAFEFMLNIASDPALNDYPKGGGGKVVNWLKDGGAQTDYINNVVKPLVTRYKGYYTVFGYDIMNECYSAVSRNTCTWPQMHNYIYNVAKAIHSVDSAAQVTCSIDAGSFASNVFYDRAGGCGLDYYEYHNYDDYPNLFTVGSGGPYPKIDKPVLLGEYGQDSLNNETAQDNATDDFINQASYKGLAGAMAWDYDPTGRDDRTYVEGVGTNGSTQYWHDALFTLRWYSINKFGL